MKSTVIEVLKFVGGSTTKCNTTRHIGSFYDIKRISEFFWIRVCDWRNMMQLQRVPTMKCHLFSMGHDFHATTIFFHRVSVRMGILTGTIICLVFYIYLRRIFAYEKLVHQAELFRHNWCVETEEMEKRLNISVKNRLFDTSLLYGNIDDPETKTILGLLPRDKLATIPHPIRIKIGFYILLIPTFFVIWLILLFEITVHSTGHNTRCLFSVDNFAFSRMYEVLKAHRWLMDVKEERHKCIGTMKDLKAGLSSSVMTIIKVFVWDHSLSMNTAPICYSIISLAILLDLAIQGLFYCRLDHRMKDNDGNRYIYFYGVAKQYFVSFFVFSMFIASALITEQLFWKYDRHQSVT